jgi:hypothetical protein
MISAAATIIVKPPTTPPAMAPTGNALATALVEILLGTLPELLSGCGAKELEDGGDDL